MSGAPASRKAMRLKIHGRVQGVFFRDSMRREAQQLGIAGWVRNCRDGSVEAFIQGDEADVSTMVCWAHHGPPGARVTQVDARETSTDTADGFEIRYD